MQVKLHDPTFGEDEIKAAIDVLRSTYVTSGEKVKEFESKFGPYAVFCNSGSSANLLAIATLCNPALENHLSPGDEVIVSALSWSTTIWPLIQYGLVPVIVDIDPDTLNIDPKEIEKAIGPRTKAIMPVHVYGNPCDMNAIREFGLIVIEDCCEALGADVGHSDFNTYSFYFSHHITTLEGGMVVANSTEHADMLRVLRAHGWTREMTNRTHHEGIDDKFLFINAGYNLRSTELNAAIGLVQIEKLQGFVNVRRRIAANLIEDFSEYDQFLSVQKDMGSSWFGFPIVVRKHRTERIENGAVRLWNQRIDVNDLRNHFEKNGIETRSIICGNIARQPGMKLWPHRIVGNLEHADHVMSNGFSIGCHQGMTEKSCEYIKNVLDNYNWKQYD